MDFSKTWEATEICFYMDATKNSELGFGGWCVKSWMVAAWDTKFLDQVDLSIEYLELFAVTAGILAWIHRFENKRIVLFCDNQSVCHMLNNTSSSCKICCKSCMVLIRIIVLKNLIHNVRVFAKYVNTKQNVVADVLSRLQFNKFQQLQELHKLEMEPTKVPDEIWPMQKVWM